MRPKGKLFALLALLAAIGLITASGAFTTVTATRTATVETAGDASALVGLEPHQVSSNGAGAEGYASTNTDNELEITLAKSDDNGVNLNAVTKIELVFNITNNGAQEVDVAIIKSGANSGLVEFYNGTASTPFNHHFDNGSSNISLSPGQTAQVSMKIDTTTDDTLDGDETILSNIEIVADESTA